MFDVECILKLLMLKATLVMYAISRALVFVKSKDMLELYDSNNPWIIRFSVKVLPIPSPPCQKWKSWLCIMV
jgi:hypothetical protein